jgi:U32 family peptidase
MSKIHIPELLAPAGSIESLKAGINSGADAVYLSGKRFGARQFAHNFSLKEMEEAIEFAHLRGVKAYVTVNTLIKETELSKVGDHLLQLYSLGADAVIVQDLGVARLARELVPDLDLHCSTQMSIHNQQGVHWAADSGFNRVVLAREMNLEDIKLTASQLKKKIELEVFAHGAICYSYSGQCLLSSFIGGRSGNRGMCAQPCRKKYQIIQANTDKYGKYTNNEEIPLKDHYLLSTRDLGIYPHLDRIVQSPVDSIKIEGRMRPPEYVANVVKVYREALDLLAKGKWKARKEEISKLQLCFNRSLTNGWIMDKNNEHMMGRDNPGNRGLYLGKVTSYNKNRSETIINLKSKVKVEKGDGILIKDPKKTGTSANIWGIVLEHSPPIKNGNLFIKLRKRVEIGSEVFITRKKSMVDEADKIVANPQLPHKIPLEIEIRWNDELTPIVSVKASPTKLGKVEIKYEADFSMENAVKRPLSAETIIIHLQKTGGTPFIIKDIQMDYPGNLFTPIRNLNHLRRQILEEVQKRILETSHTSAGKIRSAEIRLSSMKKNFEDFEEKESTETLSPPVNLAIYVDCISSLESALEAGCKVIYFQPKMKYQTNYSGSDGDFYCVKHPRVYENYSEEIGSSLKEAKSLCSNYDADLIWKWPDITNNEFIKFANNLLKNIHGTTISGVEVGGLGALWALKDEFDSVNIYGSAGLNIWNHMSIDELLPSLNSVTLSPELSLDELKKVIRQYRRAYPGHNFELLVQGNLEAMVSEDCLPCILNKNVFERLKNSSSLFWGIKDSKNRIFPVEIDERCRTHISNSVELCLIDHLPLIVEVGLDRLVIDARNKPADYVRKMVSLYQEALQLTVNKNPNLDKKLYSLKKRVKKISNGGITTGNFLRGVNEDH